MEIYIGNIPKGARPTELKKLIKETLRANVFEGMYERMAHMGRLEKGVTVAIHNARRNNSRKKRTYRYGRVNIESNNMARVIMDNMTGTSLRGKALKAREFIERKEDRDRRGSGDASTWRDSEDRRIVDRRQH